MKNVDCAEIVSGLTIRRQLDDYNVENVAIKSKLLLLHFYPANKYLSNRLRLKLIALIELFGRKEISRIEI